MPKKQYLCLIGIFLLFQNSICFKRTINPNFNNKKVWGFKPVYGKFDTSVYSRITYDSTPQSVVNPGNINVNGNMVFQTEVGKGIHIIDNTNPKSAHRIGFIQVYGCTQISTKGNYIYTNNYSDLIVIDMKNLAAVPKRVVAAFERIDQYPPGAGYYECPSYDKFVVRWVQDSVFSYCYH